MNKGYADSLDKIKSGQSKAWRTGGLKFTLAMLCNYFGYEKVEKELKNIKEEYTPDALQHLFD